MKVIALLLAGLAAANAEDACSSHKSYKPCAVAANCYWKRPVYKREKINAFRSKMTKVSPGMCMDKPTTCADATAATCGIVSAELCTVVNKKCVAMTECSQAKTDAACQAVTSAGIATCSYDKGYRRGRRWIRKPSCFTTPNSCADATSLAACKAAPGTCAWSKNTCVALESCSDATGKVQCGMVSGCVFVPKYGKARPNDQCIDAPTTCAAAPSIATCNGVTDQVCKFTKAGCTQITECADATTAAQCGALAGCSYDKGYKRGRRTIRKASCATTPATCADATNMAFCGMVDSNCAFVGKKCIEVTTCEEATNQKTCDGVTDCAYTPRKRVRQGRRMVWKAATCVYDGPTGAPTMAPMTNAECQAFNGKKNQCQANASRGCIWNKAKAAGRPDKKKCTNPNNK